MHSCEYDWPSRVSEAGGEEISGCPCDEGENPSPQRRDQAVNPKDPIGMFPGWSAGKRINVA